MNIGRCGVGLIRKYSIEQWTKLIPFFWSNKLSCILITLSSTYSLFFLVSTPPLQHNTVRSFISVSWNFPESKSVVFRVPYTFLYIFDWRLQLVRHLIPLQITVLVAYKLSLYFDHHIFIVGFEWYQGATIWNSLQTLGFITSRFLCRGPVVNVLHIFDT